MPNINSKWKRSFFFTRNIFAFGWRHSSVSDDELSMEEKAMVRRLEGCSFFYCIDIEEERLTLCGLSLVGTWGITWIH